ncbi:MAG: O-antigen ligase family protein, partial [Bacteroidota bacterium]
VLLLVPARPQHDYYVPTTSEYLRSIADPEGGFSNRERVLRWQLALRMAADRPLFGHGPGRYAPNFKDYLHDKAELERISYWFGFTKGGHSDLLTALAETGYPGALLLLAFFSALGHRLWQNVQRSTAETRFLHLGLFFALSTWLVHGLFNDLLAVQPYVLLIGAAVGMVVYHTPHSGED